MKENILTNKTFLNTLNQHGTCLCISTQAMINNHKILQKTSNNTVAYVLKNNAYGLGIENICPILYKEGCKEFFVAAIEEAHAIKKYAPQAKVYVFNGIFANQATEMYKHGFIPVLNSLEQIQSWQNLAIKQQTQLPCLLHIETGIHRFGLENADVTHLKENPKLLEGLNILYIMAHFACADMYKHKSIEEQYESFVALTKELPKTKYSLSASYGLFVKPKYQFNLSRVGIALYGGNPTPYTKNPMEPVIFFYSTIQQVKTLEKGEYVGYGYNWQANRKTKLAVLPVGYADGVIRSASNKGFAYIGKYKAPIVGTISMDLTTLDITDIPEEFHKTGQIVELIGNNISLNDFAVNADTIHCEILNVLGTRYPRLYL